MGRPSTHQDRRGGGFASPPSTHLRKMLVPGFAHTVVAVVKTPLITIRGRFGMFSYQFQEGKLDERPIITNRRKCMFILDKVL